MFFLSRAVSGVRVASVVLGAFVLAAAALGYWFFISQQREYIIGRDFRLLSNVARQLDNTVQAEVGVIKNLADDAAATTGVVPGALTERWVQLRGRPYQATDIRFETAPPGYDTASALRVQQDGHLVLDVVTQPSRRGVKALVATLKVQPGLESILTSGVRQGAFDAILLGTRDGTVLLSAGPPAQQIRSSGLGVLSSKATDGSKPVAFSDLARSITMADVTLAGVDYTLFLFPCCLSADKPLVLAGLVRAETLRSGSWAISTTLVKLSVLALLVVMVGWPFLKLVLLGDRQQVRVADFFQLGASSVAGLAIVTVVLLDVAAYLRLNRDTDVQLRDLAYALDDHATSEIRDAYAQLQCLEEKIAAVKKPFQDGKLSSVLDLDKEPSELRSKLMCERPLTQSPATAREIDAENNRLVAGPRLPWRYPFFETVAFIDRDGMQQVKLGTSGNVPNRINVADREYFKTVVRGRGWNRSSFCDKHKCALESVWSRTIGEPLAVLAKESSLKWPPDDPKPLPVAAISIPMRSLIGPVLPPGFAFAVIDHSGKVLFHSDRHRNGSEDLFVETDNNRRLRAQVAAHSAEPLNISYWGSQYRAYLKPMTLPDMYIVAMAHKERAWAINREWLVVALIFVAIYLAMWLLVALGTLGPNASWVWPDAARRSAYFSVSAWCGALLVLALMTVWFQDRKLLLILGASLPLAGWIGAYLFLRHRPRRVTGSRREPLFAYSMAAVLVLLVTGVMPGALLFLASYQLHARSYIKNSQLIVARRLSERLDRLNEEYLSADRAKPSAKRLAATHVGLMDDRDVYVRFLYNTSIRRASTGLGGSASVNRGVRPEETAALHAADHDGDMVLSFLEDYLPYYSEASVEWRELLHDHADDRSWESKHGEKGIRDTQTVLTSRTGSLPVELTSWVPSITYVPPMQSGRRDTSSSDEDLRGSTEPEAVATTGSAGGRSEESGTRDSRVLLLLSGVGLLALTWGVVQIFNGRIYLVGITEPLWACGQLALNAGENVFVLCDKTNKANQLAGLTPLQLGPIVQERDLTGAWRRALRAVDERSDEGVVLIDDFDEDLDDARGMEHKLALLDELVSDQSRTVIVLSQVSLRALTDSLRHSARVTTVNGQKRMSGQKTTSAAASETTLERWGRVLKAFVVVERRDQEATRPITETPSPAQSWSDRFGRFRRAAIEAFLTSEGRAHPYVRRLCEDLRRSDAVKNGRLTRRQAFDEVAERTAQFYRGLWTSCSEDEKVVLGHIAQHGLANASVRSVVRRLLGRRLLCKDPSFRPMNETFRRFILTRECSQQVTALETESGPSAWDRLHAPLGVAVVGLGVFLFATQKELYNAILGVTTAAAVSVPTLIRAVVMLVGRPVDGPGTKA
jgi:hypothetical protein